MSAKKEFVLVLGGARSGKSDWAQSQLEAQARDVLFVATATAGDAEMQSRIQKHRANRPANWKTLEAQRNVGQAIVAAKPKDWVLLDCVTMLASNVLFSLPEPVIEADYQKAMRAEIEALIDAWHQQDASWMLISNEVGLGLVPPNALSRYYRDELGRANQRLAKAATKVVFMVAGIPMVIKDSDE